MLEVVWQVGSAVLALAGVYLLWRQGTWPREWPVKGEPVILGLLGFIIYAAFLFGASTAAERLRDDPANLHLVVGGIRLVCIAIAFGILKYLIHNDDPMHAFRPKSLREIGPAIAPYVLVLPLMYVITTNVDQQAAVDLMNFEGFAARAYLFLSVVVAAPLFEELLFRGFLQGAMRRGYSAGVSVLTVAVFFALVHEHSVRVPVFCLGLLLGAVYEKTRGFWAPWLIHTLHNLITYVFIVSGGVDAH